MIEKLKEEMTPLGWLFLFLFVIVEVANYRHESQLMRVCELTGEHDFSYSKPLTSREELDTICLSVAPIDDDNSN